MLMTSKLITVIKCCPRKLIILTTKVAVINFRMQNHPASISTSLNRRTVHYYRKYAIILKFKPNYYVGFSCQYTIAFDTANVQKHHKESNKAAMNRNLNNQSLNTEITNSQNTKRIMVNRVSRSFKEGGRSAT